MSERASERRQSARRSRAEDHGIVSIRVRPGYDAALVNVCAGGVLIETAHRLLPGSQVELHVEMGTRHTSVRGRVLRCMVVRIQASCVSYRGAIGFDRHQSWVPADDRSGSGLPTDERRSALDVRADATPQVL